MKKIAVIDSGVGGISTLGAITKLLPNESYVYCADCSFLPYGNKTESQICSRVLDVCSKLFSMYNLKAVVVACNTATGAAIEQLRAKYKKTVIVGVEPAIKPAVNELKYGKALVLLTVQAAKQKKFLDLVASFDSRKLAICPQPHLAQTIEGLLFQPNIIKSRLKEMLNGCINEEVESIVLGCTHYCLVKNELFELFSKKIYDGNLGAALRLYGLLRQKKLVEATPSFGIEFVKM